MSDQIQATAYRINYVSQTPPIEISFSTNDILIRETHTPFQPEIHSVIQYYDTPGSITHLQTFEVEQTLSTLIALANAGCATHIRASILAVEDTILDSTTQYSFPIEDISIWPFTPSGWPFYGLNINSFIKFKGVKYYASELAADLEEDAENGCNGITPLSGGGTGVDNTDPASVFNMNGFIQQGSLGVPLKEAYHVDVTPASNLSTTSFNLAIDPTKIISITGVVNWSGGGNKWVPPFFGASATGTMYWTVYTSDAGGGLTGVLIDVGAMATDVASKEVRVLIKYKQ